MRYSREHKIETHARIVKRASVQLRQKGAHGIGVADLMKDAGLTHGGFYAHFDSREALVIEAFAYAMDRSTERWRKLAEETAPEKRLAAIVNSYLTTLHRDDPGHGCAVPTLGAEIARESPKTRKAFAAKLEQMIDMLAEQFPGLPRKAARKRAMATVATMMGTLVLARDRRQRRLFRRNSRGRARRRARSRAGQAGRKEIRSQESARDRAVLNSAPARTDRPTTLAYARRKARLCLHFRKSACASKPFPNAANTARCRQNPARSLGRNACARSDILSAAVRSRAPRARFSRRFRADDGRGPGQGGARLQGRTARGRRERQGRAAGLGAPPTRSAAPA